MRFLFTITLFIITLANSANAQYIQKKWFDKTDSIYGFYTVVPPMSGRVQGAVILLDGFGGNADNFFTETKIHNVAWTNDLLTVAIPTGMRYYMDNSMKTLLDKIITEVRNDYGLRKDQFAIGGMSSGGMIAMRYAELCHERPTDFPMLPQAVFAVDSPLDLIRLYERSQREIEKNLGWWVGEAKGIVDTYKKDLGDPVKDLDKYKAISPLITVGKDSTNERFLRNVAVRSYHDVDVTWSIKNRGRSINELNMVDGSELIARLSLMGNKEAEFMASKIPGQRSNGLRHPHSWNIVDEIELVQWLKDKLHFYPDHLKESYQYTAPENWGREIILFPMSFAPELKYKGFEDLRFAPGFSDANSEEKWAYTILWWLDGKYEMNEATLTKDLTDYYNGLTQLQSRDAKIDLKLYSKSKINVKKTTTVKDDAATYTAIGTIFDAPTSKPVALNFKIHVKNCTDPNRTIALIEVASASTDKPVWKQLDLINSNFSCK